MDGSEEVKLECVEGFVDAWWRSTIIARARRHAWIRGLYDMVRKGQDYHQATRQCITRAYIRYAQSMAIAYIRQAAQLMLSRLGTVVRRDLMSAGSRLVLLSSN